MGRARRRVDGMTDAEWRVRLFGEEGAALAAAALGPPGDWDAMRVFADWLEENRPEDFPGGFLAAAMRYCAGRRLFPRPGKRTGHVEWVRPPLTSKARRKPHHLPGAVYREMTYGFPATDDHLSVGSAFLLLGMCLDRMRHDVADKKEP